MDNYDSYEKAMERNKEAIKAVTSINDPELFKRKKICLKELNESPKHLKRYFGEDE